MNKNLKVKKWIMNGELSPRRTDQRRILQQCGDLLDASCSGDILGEVLFQATNNKYYVITVEALISPANPNYVKECLERQKGITA